MSIAAVAAGRIGPIPESRLLVDTDGNRVRGLFGRVTTIAPGTACLVFRGRIDQGQPAAEPFRAKSVSG